jgi:hypothetical protein
MLTCAAGSSSLLLLFVILVRAVLSFTARANQYFTAIPLFLLLLLL